MNVIFIEPAFPANQREFVRGLAEAGANVIGIGERPGDWLDADLRGWMIEYQQIPNVTDVGALIEAVRFAQSKVWVDALESTIESHTMAAAYAREACGIPGTSVRTAYLCRDKPAMKEALRAVGIQTAQSIGASSAAEVREFVASVGYPIILKPRAAAGASGTSRVDSDAELDRALCGAGCVRRDRTSRSRSSSRVTRVSTTPSASTGIRSTTSSRTTTRTSSRRCASAGSALSSSRPTASTQVEDYSEVRDLGLRAIEALGIGTSATHMEWFFGPKGLRFSEIGCRPPGVRAWDLYAAGNDIDIYREWANAIVHHSVERQLSRRRAAGIVALRPDRDGTISHYEGLEEVQQRFGEWILDSHLPGERHADSTGRGRVHGQCVDTDGPPRLRHGPPHAQRRRGDGARARLVRQVTLLGPLDGVDLAAEIEAFGVEGPVALVTAGWEEGERNDAEIDRRLGGGSRNLNLYGRRLDVLESDAAFADAERLLRTQLDDLREIYLASPAPRARRGRRGPPSIRRCTARSGSGARRGDRCGPGARRVTSSAIAAAYERFFAQHKPHERPSIARHREEVAAIVAECGAIAIAGGHVGVLNDCLHLHNLALLIEERPMIAWSSGCMAVSERIVVADDDDPAGRPDEVYDIGIGVARGDGRARRSHGAAPRARPGPPGGACPALRARRVRAPRRR